MDNREISEWLTAIGSAGPGDFLCSLRSRAEGRRRGLFDHPTGADEPKAQIYEWKDRSGDTPRRASFPVGLFAPGAHDNVNL